MSETGKGKRKLSNAQRVKRDRRIKASGYTSLKFWVKNSDLAQYQSALDFSKQLTDEFQAKIDEEDACDEGIVSENLIKAELNEVIRNTSKKFKVTRADLMGKVATHQLWEARRHCWKEMLNMEPKRPSVSGIARLFDREPSTIKYAVEKA